MCSKLANITDKLYQIFHINSRTKYNNVGRYIKNRPAVDRPGLKENEVFIF